MTFDFITDPQQRMVGSTTVFKKSRLKYLVFHFLGT